MRLALRKATTRSVGKLHLRKGGVTKEVVRAWVRQGGVTKQFYSSLSSGGGQPGISVDPDLVFGTVNRATPTIVTSGPASVTVVGGVPPYSYAWSRVSGDATINPTAASSATTAFQASVSPGNERSAVFKCTVTDAASVAQDSPTVTVDLDNIGGTL